MNILMRVPLFNTYAKFSEKLTFGRMCAYQGVRNVSF